MERLNKPRNPVHPVKIVFIYIGTGGDPVIFVLI
jgi:hypothetical protein